MIMADKKYILAVWVLLCALVLSLCVGVYMLPQDNDAEQSNEEPVENTSLLTEKSQDVIRVLAAGRDRASGLYDVIMLVSFDKTICGLVSEGAAISPDTIDARNHIILKLKSK